MSGYDEYRREARHLRKVYADDPERLHRSLQQLSHRHDVRSAALRQLSARKRADAVHSPAWRSPSRATCNSYEAVVPERSRAAVDWFADRVAAKLDGATQILRYSQRLALLKDAARLGIARFPANLMIATLQHERRESRDVPFEAAIQPNRLPWLLVAAFVVTIQAAIACAAWFVIHPR